MGSDLGTAAPPHQVEVHPGEVQGRTRAMATDITIRAPVPPGNGATALPASVGAALRLFERVESVCTRFDPNSPLMVANRAPDMWQNVDPLLFDALRAAYDAYQRTDGRFDPRVYGALLRLGYDRSLPFSAGDVVARSGEAAPSGSREPWQPSFDPDSRAVCLGPDPVELGGIGKGLAVRWAAESLARVTSDFLVEAGGDCYCAGWAPRREQWRVGVEDPAGARDPVAVVELRDRACTTSSIRLRHWTVDGRRAHHLIDPATGEPGGEGLSAVTVIDVEPAMAEVWSKTLFLAGSTGIAAEAGHRQLAALWVTSDGKLGVSAGAKGAIIWVRPGMQG